MNTGAIARKARAVVLAKRALSCLAPLAMLGACSALWGCPGTTTPVLYTPFTGIVIHASDVVAGHGCGQGAGQVYRYAVIVSYAAPEGGAVGGPLYASVFDCFEDGVFENLPPTEAGAQQFSLQVLAYTKAGFPAGLECPGGVDPSGNPCNLEIDRTFAAMFAGDAQWQTTCTATQQQGAPVVAVCEPVEPTDAGATPTEN